MVLSFILLAAAGAASADPPAWPGAIRAVWPTRWISHNYTGYFPYGPSPYDQCILKGTWYFNWPTNQWRQDTCVKYTPTSPPICKVELWNGNDHTAGSADVGTTYTYNQNPNGTTTCSYSPSKVPSITRPDFAAMGTYSGRANLNGVWSDIWSVDTHKFLHYNFTSSMDINTAHPVQDCGPTLAQPPWAYGCSNHTNVQTGDEFADDDWASYFALDTTNCTAKTVDAVESVPTMWPGALIPR